MDVREGQRRRMVEEQLAGRDITDPRVLSAMSRVPRHLFVPEATAGEAYLDTPLPIGCGQTISQPYIVALTAQALDIDPAARILEIGTGSGYAAAVLSLLGREVFTVERHEELAALARDKLHTLGYKNVFTLVEDGTLGFPKGAPYDAIAVTASGPSIPLALVSQLAAGGRMVIPIGPDDRNQRLVVATRAREGGLQVEDLGAVRFVPLIGKEGWPAVIEHGRR